MGVNPRLLSDAASVVHLDFESQAWTLSEIVDSASLSREPSSPVLFKSEPFELARYRGLMLDHHVSLS